MSNIIDLKLFELVEKIKKKEISSQEVTKSFIDRSQKSKKKENRRKSGYIYTSRSY